MQERQWQGFGWIPGCSRRYCSPFRAISHSLGAPCSWVSQQITSRQVQVRQGAGGKRSVGILHEAPIAHPHKAEDALDQANGVLDLGSHLRFHQVLRPLGLIEAAPQVGGFFMHDREPGSGLFEATRNA